MKQKKKLLWADLDDGIRKPNSKWKLGNAAPCFAKIAGVAVDAVVFINPNGRRSRSDKTIGALRDQWREWLA